MFGTDFLDFDCGSYVFIPRGLELEGLRVNAGWVYWKSIRQICVILYPLGGVVFFVCLHPCH